MKIGELFVRLGVQADTFTVKDFARAVGEVPLSVAAAITSLAGMSLGFLDLTKNTLDMGNSLSIFRDQTGLSTKELQQWQDIALQVGMSGDVVTNSILGISNALAQIKLGQGQGPILALGRLGVNSEGKSPFEILQEIGEASQHMNRAVAGNLMSQLGVNPAMMRIFALPSSERARMLSQSPVMKDNDIRAMQEFQQALGLFSITLMHEFVPVLTQMEPYMKDLAEVMGDFVQVVGALTVGGAKLSRVLFGHDARIDDWIKSPGNESFEQYKKSHPAGHVTNVTQNIHSNADADEVARIAEESFIREKTRAAKQIGNSGY